MQAAIVPERDLSAANGARRHRAAGLAVYSKSRREARAEIARPHIEQISCLRIARVVNEMQNASLVDGHLRLDAAFRHAEQTDVLGSFGGFFSGHARKRRGAG